MTWSSPVTNRLLLEAGFGATFFGVGNFERNPNPTRDLIRVAEQCASGCANNGNIPGLVYRSQDFSNAHTGSYLWKGTVAFVTGTHSLKVGYQHALMTDDRTWMTNTRNLMYRFNDGVPNQLTQSTSPWVNNARVAWDAVYVQEQWTRQRLTLQGAVRFDRARSWFPLSRKGHRDFCRRPSSFRRRAASTAGVGFDVDTAWTKGLGLISMRERLEAIGGTIEIQSQRGAGTRLEARLPLSIGRSPETAACNRADSA